jgi:hypothetical protein
MKAADDELTIGCPYCPAAAGEPCELPSGDARPAGPHVRRVKAAERAVLEAKRRAEGEAPDRIPEHRWRRVYVAARLELEQRGDWTRLAAEQLESLVRNMAQADAARELAETTPTVTGSTGQTVANPMYAIATKLDAQALITARTLKLTPDTRGTSASVPDDGADADEDRPPEELDELAKLDELARHRKAKAAGK